MTKSEPVRCGWAKGESLACSKLRRSVVLSLSVALGFAGCTSNCENAGVSVDGNGNIVVRGENGFISPNSSVLKNVTDWPKPPGGEQSFAFSQGYALTRDGAGFYLLADTAEHPNLVYRINLRTGRATRVGEHELEGGRSTGDTTGEGAASAASRETWIASQGRDVYSVDQKQPAISRGIATKSTKLTPFIVGSRTQLHGPIGIAADRDRLCALDGESLFVLCYAPGARGNVKPTQSIDTKALLGWEQVDAITFGKLGRLALAGTTDPNGLRGFSIAVFAISTGAPRLLRKIEGTNTHLQFPESIAADRLGNILILQQDSQAMNAGSQVLAFGPRQQGNVAPISVRDPAASVSNAFRMAIDNASGDVAILGSDGTAYFPKGASQAPDKWPKEEYLPARGWDLAFGSASLIVADEFGTPIAHGLPEVFRESSSALSSILDLQDPEFISTDQTGRAYVASPDGIVTALPADPNKPSETTTISFRTPYERDMSSFAVDSAGYYYLSSTTNDAIIVVGPNGRQATLEGSNTGLNHPMGLAVGQDGTLFVANSGDKNILKFRRGSGGDAAPVGRIEGASTELIAPQALAVDSAGKLYAFDGPVAAGGSGAQHYVRVYDAASGGDIAPLKSYEVQTKCWVEAP